ncbi:SDR family NAD(P)-dependent oxidoreductase [Acinetobacter baumannii]
MKLSLEGQNILVTGSENGIGKSIVKRLSSEGANVIIQFEKDKKLAESLLREIGNKGWIIQADLSALDGPFKLWEKALIEAGQIHAIVNNASIRTELSIDSPPESWQAIWRKEFQINFFAAADLCKEAIAHFKLAGKGRIINITSRAGQRGYVSEALPYGCSKAALINLTKSIARSFGNDGITAVAIAPGWVQSELDENSISNNAKQSALAEIPIAEMVKPEELAELVSFVLIPSQLSLNGSTIDINGGSYIR